MNSTITLPEGIITNLPQANPMYTVLYIQGLLDAQNNPKAQTTISTKATATKFNILESDVISAWQYWQAKRLVHLTFNDDIVVEFIQEQANKKEDEVTATLEAPIPTQKIFAAKPLYHPQELEMYKQSHSIIDNLFKTAETAMAKPLNANELSTIYSFYDWLRLPVDVIEALLHYCSENNHRNINYIEKIAIDWSEKGIDTLDKLTDHLQNNNKAYREVLKALGQSSRNITPKEITYIDKWLKDQNHTLEIVLEACDKTIINLGKPSFTYLDKILTTWYEDGVTTIADIIKQSKPKPLPIKKPAKFSNFTSESTDYDNLENMSINLIRKQRI